MESVFIPIPQKCVQKPITEHRIHLQIWVTYVPELIVPVIEVVTIPITTIFDQSDMINVAHDF